MRADSIYSTVAEVDFHQLNTQVNGAFQSHSNDNSVAFASAPPSNFGFSGSGYAEADRGVLHAFAETGGCYISSCGAYGDLAFAQYKEYGAKAIVTGPDDLLPNIIAYKFTFDAHGTVFPEGTYFSNYAGLQAFGFQNGATVVEEADYFANALGPASFYLKIPDPTKAFDFEFNLWAITNQIGSVNFRNTATLTSVEAVDANNHVIPGVELGLADGTYLGANGYSTSLDPSGPTPAPTRAFHVRDVRHRHRWAGGSSASSSDVLVVWLSKPRTRRQGTAVMPPLT